MSVDALPAMAVAQEFDQVAPGIFVWHLYDRAVKADLFSTALETPGGMYLVDPLPLSGEALQALAARSKVAGIVVTNENHERAARLFADRFSVPIYVEVEGVKALALPEMIELRGGNCIEPGLTVIPVPGGPSGEIAIHYDRDGGTLIVGDALINFEPHGFGLLPPKYCRDIKLMRRSLPRILEYPFERMLFAHGTPILTKADARLEQLVAENC